MSLFKNREILKNSKEYYKSILDKKGVKEIRQYETPVLKYPTPKQIQQLVLIPHVWSKGDRLFKLSNRYYKTLKDGYIIAFFNKLPTESHIKIGETINIPTPLHKVKKFMGI